MYKIDNSICYWQQDDGEITRKDKDLIKKVIIKDGTVEVSPRVFANCEYLEEVILPASVELIDKYAFEGCESLSKINLENVGYIDKFAFRGCALQVLVLNSVILNQGSFEDCDKLTDVIIRGQNSPDGFIIPNSCFYNCIKLETVTFDALSVRIEKHAFAYCTNLSILKYSENIKYIGIESFLHCINLSEVVLDKAIGVDYCAFAACYSFRHLVLGPETGVMHYIFGDDLNDRDICTGPILVECNFSNQNILKTNYKNHNIDLVFQFKVDIFKD